MGQCFSTASPQMDQPVANIFVVISEPAPCILLVRGIAMQRFLLVHSMAAVEKHCARELQLTITMSFHIVIHLRRLQFCLLITCSYILKFLTKRERYGYRKVNTLFIE